MSNIFLKLSVITILLFSIANAENSDELSKRVQKKISVVMDLLKDDALQKEQRERKILSEIEVLFDYKLISRLSLGKVWKSFDKKKREEFTEKFTKKLKHSYLEKVRLYTDEKVEFVEPKQTKENRIEMISYIVGKNDKKEVLYKFHKSKSRGWLIYDLEIEGVSILRTYRSQFAAELKNGSIDTLLEKLCDQC